ncbi:hypothetical protein LCGC14_1144210 [marine sediment metagenome]|uniref:Uncharacterized protein n=1 Tax=marine sediment metagenome TaxID=412755 RepID=A0A0F9LXH4_9ZZZZ
MTHHRGAMFISKPPVNMKSPVGRWWCYVEDKWAWNCADKNEHAWVIKWQEKE